MHAFVSFMFTTNNSNSVIIYLLFIDFPRTENYIYIQYESWEKRKRMIDRRKKWERNEKENSNAS